MIRRFQHIRMHFRRTDGSDNAFAYPGDDRSLTRAADQSFNIRAYRNPCLDPQFNTILGYRADHRRFNHFRINAHLHCFQHITPGQINRTGPFKSQRNLCPMSRNQRVNHTIHITAGQIMGFQLVGIHVQPRLICLNQRQHDLIRRYPAQPHPYQIKNADVDSCRQSRYPEPHRHKLEKNKDRKNNQ